MKRTGQCQVHLRSNRKGVAAVEVAVLLPLLLIVVFGTLATSQLIYHRKSMVVAAHEGIRLASQRSVTSAEVLARVNAILASRRIDNAVITLTPTEIDQAIPGELIELRVQADYNAFGATSYGSLMITGVNVNAAILRE